MSISIVLVRLFLYVDIRKQDEVTKSSNVCN